MNLIICKAMDMALRNKLETFRMLTGTRKGLAVTMITTHGIKKNMYSGFIQSEVVLDDLFEPRF